MASHLKPADLVKFAHGFTLVELLISLALGLLISGAALALFLESSKNKRAQESVDDIQDAAVFGLHYLEKEIAMANLGAYRPMSANSPATGLLLSTSIASGSQFIGNLAGFGHQQKFAALVSSSNSHPSNTKLQNSDQLTIQYTAPFEMANCEGAIVHKGQVVVERIFTREATRDSTNELVLACNAGTYDRPVAIDSLVTKTDQYAVTATQLLRKLNSRRKGSVLINRVDHFTVKLGIISEQGLQYMTINEYCGGGCDTLDEIKRPVAQSAIVAIKLGMIVRSRYPVGAQGDNKYRVLGENVVLDTSKTENKYTRRVLEKTIRLKNSVLPTHASAAPYRQDSQYE